MGSGRRHSHGGKESAESFPRADDIFEFSFEKPNSHNPEKDLGREFISLYLTNLPMPKLQNCSCCRPHVPLAAGYEMYKRGKQNNAISERD